MSQGYKSCGVHYNADEYRNDASDGEIVSSLKSGFVLAYKLYVFI